MTQPRLGLVSYDGLPLGSGGAHGLGRRTILESWEAANRFFADCTNTIRPSVVTLSINGVEDTPPEFVNELRESSVRTLGVCPSPHRRDDYGGRGQSLIWHIPSDRASDAVEWRASLGNLPKNWLGGPAVLSLDFRFRLKAADGNSELAYQGSEYYLNQAYDGYGTLLGDSVARLNLSSRNTLSLILFFPYEVPSPELWKDVEFMQSRLPFPLSAKHWRHWHLTKKGTAYVGRRIKEPALD